MPVPFDSCLPFSWVCGYAAATRYSPRGGRRRSREEGWNCIGSSTLQGEDHLADVAALLDEAVRVRALVERELLGHDRPQLAALDPLAKRLDVLVERALGIPQREHV